MSTPHDLDHVLPELAHHFTLAAPLAGPERAVEYNLRAGQAATATAAYEEATIRFQTALDLGIPDPHTRARTQVELGYLLSQTRHIAESDAVLAESLVAATGLREPGLAAHALVNRLGNRLADPGVDLEELERGFEDTIETFTRLGDERGLALAGRQLGVVLTRLGRTDAGTAELERAFVHADASGDRTARRQVVGTLAHFLCQDRTPVSEAVQRCEDLLATYGSDYVLEAVITRFLGLLHAMAGRPGKALELVERSSRVLDEVGYLTQSWVYRWAAAAARVLAGDLEGAEREHLATVEGFRGSGYRGIDEREMGASYRLAELYCDEGRWDEAAKCVAFFREIAEPPQITTVTIRRRAVEAQVGLQRGRLAEATGLAERAVAAAILTDAWDVTARSWLALSNVRRAEGRAADADAAFARAIEVYEAKGNIAAAARLRAAENALAG